MNGPVVSGVVLGDPLFVLVRLEVPLCNVVAVQVLLKVITGDPLLRDCFLLDNVYSHLLVLQRRTLGLVARRIAGDDFFVAGGRGS